jgi:hypothetical protein
MGLKLDTEKFRGAFERLQDKAKETASKSVEDHMKDVVFPETQLQVPKLTGALEATGEVRPGTKPGRWQIHYGNSPVNNRDMVDYAAAVHEIEDHRHAPPTKTKFVEDPLKDLLPRLKESAAKKFDDLAQG